jgi:asparagine synthase (glutamine-hydrolysing)
MIPTPIRALPGLTLKALRPGIAADKLHELLSLPNPDLASAYKLSRKVLTASLHEQLFPAGSRMKNRVENIASGFKPADSGVLTWVSQAEISTYMQNVLLRDTDQMSMAHALEVRVPFLDYQLVEYVMQLPDHIKNPLTPKKLLVDSLGDLLPSEIVNRPKMGFTLPWASWMKNELKSLCEEKLKRLGERGFLNADVLHSQWKKFLKGDPGVSWSRIWYLVVLSYWLDKQNIHG